MIVPGKTYTTVGTSGNPGVIPRAVGDLLQASQAAVETKLWTVSFSISYLEKVRDLLDTNKQDLPIRQGRSGAIQVPGLTERVIDSYTQFERIFVPASRHRMTASTQLNHTSSRSHSLLMLRVVTAEQVAPFRRFLGKLHLVALAGSEHNRRRGYSVVRLKESGSINSSLFALSKVVDALNRGSACVPYRESKLTRLLQDSLGGSAHTVMVTYLAPEQRFLFDSTSALNFASKSKQVVNRPLTLQSQQPVMKRRLSNSNDGDLGRNAAPATHHDAENTSLIEPLLKQQKTFQMEVWERLESIEQLVSHGNMQPVEIARDQQQCQPLKCGSNSPTGLKLHRLQTLPLQVVQAGTAGGNSVPVGVIAPFGNPKDVHLNAFLLTADDLLKMKYCSSFNIAFHKHKCEPGKQIAKLTRKSNRQDVFLLFLRPLLKQQKTFQMEVWERLESIEQLVSHGNMQPVEIARDQQQCQPLKCGSNSPAPQFNEKRKKLVPDILNHGNVRQLKALHKVGEKRAELIIKWREEHGPFTQGALYLWHCPCKN
uniref:kinesin-like protein KIF22-A n=1 Tax=Myxine glutinosa TaxID=7769 RepID=UPI00358DF925